MYANIFCDAGHESILIYLEACRSIGASGLSLSLYLHLYFVSVSSEGSGKSAHMHRLA